MDNMLISLDLFWNAMTAAKGMGADLGVLAP